MKREVVRIVFPCTNCYWSLSSGPVSESPLSLSDVSSFWSFGLNWFSADVLNKLDHKVNGWDFSCRFPRKYGVRITRASSTTGGFTVRVVLVSFFRWVDSCFLRALLCVKLLPHFVQLYGLCPVCTRMCLCKLLAWASLTPQMGHTHFNSDPNGQIIRPAANQEECCR